MLRTHSFVFKLPQYVANKFWRNFWGITYVPRFS